MKINESDFEDWRHGCPLYSHNGSYAQCDAKYSKVAWNNCVYDDCPYVFWFQRMHDKRMGRTYPEPERIEP